VATFLITLAVLGGTGNLTADVIRLFVIGFPVLALGEFDSLSVVADCGVDLNDNAAGA
jgi:hypothetical protein